MFKLGELGVTRVRVWMEVVIAVLSPSPFSSPANGAADGLSSLSGSYRSLKQGAILYNEAEVFSL